jgi:hypothetical protein
MPNLLFLTTTNLSTNPRLLKELKLANENGYDCTFVGFKLGNWSDKTENEHLKSLKNVRTYYLSAGISTHSGISTTLNDLQQPLVERSRNPETERSRSQRSFRLRSMALWRWLSVVEARYLTTLISKLSIFLNKIFRKSLKLNAYAHNKRTWQLVKALKKQKGDFNLVIAHNLGALYPAYKFVKKKNIPFAFDIEDYHPGEKCSPTEKHRRELLMQKILPKAAYVSYASPLIGKYSFDLINKINLGLSSSPSGRGREARVLINNSFSKNEFELKESQAEKLQLIWFSQNIAHGRGLELIIPVLAKFKDKVQLTLVGNLYNDFEASFLKNYLDFISFTPPLPQKELNQLLCRFDVGLAIELSSADFNRDICLTNKIFAYTQAGLFVLATDTAAQKKFIEEHNAKISGFDSLRLRSVTTSQPLEQAETERSRSQSLADLPLNKVEMFGLLTTQTTEEMEKAIEQIINHIETIRANKQRRFDYAKGLAWEIESEKLRRLWDDLLTSSPKIIK